MNKLELQIPPLILLLFFAFCLYLLSGNSVLAWYGWTVWSVSALVIMICALALMLSGIWSFRRAGTTVDPRNPEKTAGLVTAGVYRFTRNPMYLGMLLLLLGETCYLKFWPGLLLCVGFVLYMNRFQITAEERWLRERFGQKFMDYEQRVRRWL